MGLKEEAKRIVKHTSIYGFGGVLGKLIGFLMIPIYTKYFTKEDYGVMSLIGITTGILAIIISVGIASAMFRFYYEYEEEKERNEVISTAIIAFGVFAMVTLTLLGLCSNLFSNWILDSSEYAILFAIAFASIWFGTLSRMGMDYIRIQERSTFYMAISLSNLFVSLALNIYFIVILEMGILGIFISDIISATIFSMILVIPLLFKIGLRFSWEKCWKMVKFGAPFIISDVGRSIANKSDRLFLKEFGSLGATGLYSFGYKFGTLGHGFVTSPFLQIWFPRRLAAYKEKDAEKNFSQIFTYFIFVLTFVSLGISLPIKDVIQIMASKPEFYPAYKFVPFILFAYIIFSFYYHVSIPLFIEKKSKHMAAIDATTGIVNIALNFVLIKQFNIWGAVAATILSFMCRVSLAYIIGLRFRPITLEVGRLMKVFACAGMVYWIASFIDLGSPWMSAPCKGATIVLYPFFLWASGFLNGNEAKALRKAWSNLQSRAQA